jgi:hypothetical protein
MLTTSSEVGGLVANGTGHKLALFYGMFFWSGVVLYAGTAMVLRFETREALRADEAAEATSRAIKAPHAVKSSISANPGLKR